MGEEIDEGGAWSEWPPLWPECRLFGDQAR
jgi:hypothetical protein